MAETLESGFDPVGSYRRKAESKAMTAGIFVDGEHITGFDYDAFGARFFCELRRVRAGATGYPIIGAADPAGPLTGGHVVGKQSIYDPDAFRENAAYVVQMRSIMPEAYEQRRNSLVVQRRMT